MFHVILSKLLHLAVVFFTLFIVVIILVSHTVHALYIENQVLFCRAL